MVIFSLSLIYQLLFWLDSAGWHLNPMNEIALHGLHRMHCLLLKQESNLIVVWLHFTLGITYHKFPRDRSHKMLGQWTLDINLPLQVLICLVKTALSKDCIWSCRMNCLIVSRLLLLFDRSDYGTVSWKCKLQ
jgi:hypothetical protein